MTIEHVHERLLEFENVLQDRGHALSAVSIGELMDSYPNLKPPVIDNLICRGEVANVISVTKCGKSWLVYGLALTVCTGRDWLDTFPVTPGKI